MYMYTHTHVYIHPCISKHKREGEEWGGGGDHPFFTLQYKKCLASERKRMTGSETTDITIQLLSSHVPGAPPGSHWAERWVHFWHHVTRRSSTTQRCPAGLPLSDYTHMCTQTQTHIWYTHTHTFTNTPRMGSACKFNPGWKKRTCVNFSLPLQPPTPLLGDLKTGSFSQYRGTNYGCNRVNAYILYPPAAAVPERSNVHIFLHSVKQLQNTQRHQSTKMKTGAHAAMSLCSSLQPLGCGGLLLKQNVDHTWSVRPAANSLSQTRPCQRP